MMQNNNTIGRILSIQKILVEGVEKTPEGAEADGKVAPYMLIRGSGGNDAIVDSNGNLVCMLKGSENVPIAQDADGNMNAIMKGDDGVTKRIIAVDDSGVILSRMKGAYGSTLKDIAVDADGNMNAIMKGEYGGNLVTWKVDDEGRGEMFVHQIIDYTCVETKSGIATSSESDAISFTETVRRIRVVANDYDMYLRTSPDGTTWEDQIHIKADASKQWFDIACHSFKVQRYDANDVIYEVEGYR